MKRLYELLEDYEKMIELIRKRMDEMACILEKSLN